MFDIDTEGEFRNTPGGVNQWWRLVIGLFLHSGAIHCVMVLMVQYYCGRNIEIQAGFLRTFLIYFISGIGGNLISGIFSPRSVSLGADPAVYGLLAVMYVELFQAWQVVPKAWLQCVKLTVIIALSMLIGTLPYVDNWSHVGGLAFGFVSGVIFLPYITFGKWDARRKKVLLYVCIPLLLVMILLAFLTFYVITDSAFCPIVDGVNTCGYFNCIQWHESIDCNKYY
jgi:membrane associated rhomboid family serine protease